MLKVLNANSESILCKRYYLDGEDWPLLCERITRSVVPESCGKYKYADKEIRKLTDSCFNMINDLYFIPNSPTMFNAGTEYPMLSACFIIDVEDDLPSIYDSLKESAIIHKHGGGVGVCFGKLRGNGSRIATTQGYSRGAVSFVKVFSKGTSEITAAGKRKGANMGQLPVWHCDVEEFIDCKATEGDLSNFNLTVQLTDDFMHAVENDLDFYLFDPKDMSAVKAVKARYLMNKIVHGAWKNGEPGVCFIDRINKDNPTPHLGKITSSNPCQPSWATVLTPFGIREIGSIEVGDAVWSGQSWTKVVNKWCSGVKDVYAYRTRAGIFYGTKNHRVVQDGVKIEVSEADSIDVCSGPYVPTGGTYNGHDVVDGLVFGDGMYHKASNKVVLIVGNDDQCYFDDPLINHLFVEARPGIKDKSWDVKTTFNKLPLTYKREVPDRFRFGDFTKKVSFLRGLYSANGSVVGKRVTLKTSSEKVVEAVQEMLSSIGISSYYTTNREHDVEFDNGIYTCRESYDLNIGYEEGRARFMAMIGFIHTDKMNRLEKACAPNKCRSDYKKTYEIVDVEYVSTEFVYDLTVEDCAHTYWTGGLLVSNCGEFYSIPYNSCNLGSLNLTKYVEPRGFNWGLLEQHIRLATFYLDCIIDSNQYPLEKIDTVSKSVRPLGLGVMGFADALILQGIKYNSEEGFAFGEKVAEFLSYISLDASVDLSKIRGTYPEFRKENHTYEQYVKDGSLDWPKLVRRINKYGLRNSHTTVIAPTGTIASIANEVSHGIEPVFQFEYERNIMDGKQKGYHHIYREFLGGNIDVPENVFVLAQDISWEDHIEMQYRWQKFIHNGISKTINMPSTATEEDVLRAFLLAHQKNLKGLTVYVSGSRNNEVIVAESISNMFGYHDAPKRRNILECEIHHMQVRGQKWVAFVGMVDGKPYEIFAGLSKYVDLPKKYEKGLIIKRPYKTKPSEYDLVINKDTEDELIIRNIVEAFSNDNEGVLGRLVSLSLRHGARPAHLSDQLLKDPSDDFMTYAKCLGRILKRYISNGEKPETGTKCPECGSDLVYQEGCKSCICCSWSKCS